MKIVVIGATGHIGSSLVPRLVRDGHEVVTVSRGARAPYHDPGIWRWVAQQHADRDREEKAGTFGARVAALSADVVIDLICFTPESAQHIVSAVEGKVGHYLFCGTIWVYGYSTVVPATEQTPRRPFGDYGVRKAAAEAWLLAKAHRDAFPVTLLHPGHIVGRGWVPLNPAGNFNPAVFRTIEAGARLALPNLGLETVHHVHADDVAQAFCRAMDNRSTAAGESFNVVSPAAVTLRGYAEAMAQWFGKEPDLAFLPWEEWRKTVSTEDAAATWDHIAHSPNAGIEKARRLLHYEPRYSSLEAVCESVDWLREHDWKS